MPQSFIIIEPDPVTNVDLVGLIQTAFQGCPVSTAQALRDVAPFAAAGQDQLTLLINTNQITQAATDMLRSMATQGTQIVLLGNDIATEFPKRTVETPFTADMVLSALGADDAQRPASQPEDRAETPGR